MMKTSFLFLSLFFVDVAIGEIVVQKLRPLYSNNITGVSDVSTIDEVELVVGIIGNRFAATGVIVDVKRTAEKPEKFVMHISSIESVRGFANHGKEYSGKSVEILSEIGIPPSFRSGVEISLILRVSGDEHGQYLFLVEIINGDKI
ncbi:MAG: hypothetical protein HOG49_41505 [Candidatus Scalindua sp.]|nr:hypothetical protein [Candidatus Scalindua sp.]